jgi:hypothetical protein
VCFNQACAGVEIMVVVPRRAAAVRTMRFMVFPPCQNSVVKPYQSKLGANSGKLRLSLVNDPRNVTQV